MTSTTVQDTIAPTTGTLRSWPRQLQPSSSLRSNLQQRLNLPTIRQKVSPEEKSKAIATFTPQEEKTLNQILDQLKPDELEVAARVDYAYLLNPNDGTKRYHAMLMAKQHLDSAKNDSAKALKRIKNTLAFRKRINVEGLIRAFDDTKNAIHRPLKQHLGTGEVYVQGYDKEGRSTYIFLPRQARPNGAAWTVRQHVYSLERALACTKSKDRKVNAIVDFQGFSVKNTPPTSVGKEFMITFRDHYAAAVNQVFMVDAPMAFLCFWAIMKPFLGKRTRNKIRFVTSEKNPLQILYHRDQASSWMIPGGTKNRELDVDEYLLRTPFNCAFDE